MQSNTVISEKFDLIIIGGGPAGYTAAIKASLEGLKTAVIEEKELGGVCLNWGCIPVKSLLHSAEVFETVNRAQEFGINVSGKDFDWNTILKRSRENVAKLSEGLSYTVKKSGVKLIKGRARLLDNLKVEITGDTKTVIEGSKIIIAVGSKSVNPPGIKTDGVNVLTSHEALSLKESPESIAIIGSGALGIEFASIFRSFGAEVTIFEKFDRILPAADEDISDRLKSVLKKRGIKIMTSTMINGIDVSNGYCYLDDNSSHSLKFGKVLIAAGVTGNLAGLGLAEAGVSENWGFVMVDGNFKTTVENIYAVGDCTGPPLLAHAAFMQAEMVIDHIIGRSINPPSLSEYPLCLQSIPNVAFAGMTEMATRDAGYNTGVGRCPFHINGMAQVKGEKDGFVKIVFDRSDGRILGAHIIGKGAEDIIQELVLAMNAGLTISQVYSTIHPHPTLSEIIREAAADALGIRQRG